MKVKIGIRPVIDGRWGGIRESLEQKTMAMAKASAALIIDNCFYRDGTSAEVIVADTTIGGSREASLVDEYFRTQNVCATLSVTPCWCYGSETMDIDPIRLKAVWGFNGTERPGAVYLAAVMAAHNSIGLPAFAIYGQDVQDIKDDGMTDDVKAKIIQFAQCSLVIGQMRDKSYVNIGSTSMGIIGSICDPEFYMKYLGIRPEWVDMTEIIRRINNDIYDKKEYDKAINWVKVNCVEGDDYNSADKKLSAANKAEQWTTIIKMTLILKDIIEGNPNLAKIGYNEEALGRNGIMGGFQGQRMWTDFMPNADFSEAILNSSFDWNGKRKPTILATENDGLNGVSMLLMHLLTGQASIFADVRTYWSKEAVERVSGKSPKGLSENGFIHLINSGAAALDGTGLADNKMKKWWEMTQSDIDKCLNETRFAPANLSYFRGGGFSTQFETKSEMPVTLCRINLIMGKPIMQIAEGYTVVLDKDTDKILLNRTDPTWPSTWFVPILTGKGAFTNVYNVMSNWGANHGAFTYGHIGKELITLASMLRIPVSMHNVDSNNVFRPHIFSSFGTNDIESADFRVCEKLGALYK